MLDFKIKDIRVCLSFYILKHMKDYQVDDSLSMSPPSLVILLLKNEI